MTLGNGIILTHSDRDSDDQLAGSPSPHRNIRLIQSKSSIASLPDIQDMNENITTYSNNQIGAPAKPTWDESMQPRIQADDRPFDAILFGADANVVKPLGVVLASLRHVLRRPVSVFVLHDDIGGADQEMLHRCGGELLNIEFLTVPNEALRDELLPEHLPRAALFRLLLAEMLPSTVRRVLYLDCDVLVLDDPAGISEPADAHDPTPAIAAVRDPFRPWIGGPPPLPWREVGADARSPYFNSGVMLVDVQRWSAERVAQRALELLQAHRMPFADQCALNLVLDGQWGELDHRWNIQVAHTRGDKYLAWTYSDPSALKSALSNPAVLHFTGVDKPWRVGPVSPWAERWFEVLDRSTPWSGWRPPPKPRRSLARRLIDRLSLPFSS